MSAMMTGSRKALSLLLAAVMTAGNAAAVSAEENTEQILRNETLYAWDMSDESQLSTEEGTADMHVLTGSAEYDAENEKVRLNAASGAGVEVTLSEPVTAETAENIITVEFDANFGSISGQYFSYSITDPGGNDIVACRFTPYNSSSATEDGFLEIGGVPALTETEDKTVNKQLIDCISSNKGDGLGADTTHFENKIDLAGGTVTVNITSGGKAGSFTGSLEAGTYGGVSGFCASVTKMSTSRHTYLDNIMISQYQYVTPPSADELVHCVTAEADGDTTVVDTSKLVYGGHINAFRVTTAADCYNSMT